MELADKVFAAFQNESKELLEGIRTLVADFVSVADVRADPRLDDAYRLAHSLKGGARVCDLQPVEQLGHRLESLFEQVRQGSQSWNHEREKTIGRILDVIEDFMESLVEGESPGNRANALRQVQEILASNSSEASSSAPDSLRQRIIEAFRSEYKIYVDGILSELRAFEADAPSEVNGDEAFRFAHNLREAARVAQMEQVESVAKELETLFADVRQGMAISEAVCDAIREAVSTIEGALAEPSESAAASTAAAVAALQTTRANAATATVTATGFEEAESAPARPESAPSANAPSTVRISTAVLDRLLRSSGELLAEGLQQACVTDELAVLAGAVTEIEREWESVRRVAATRLHELANQTHYARIARFVEFVGQRIHRLSRQARKTLSLHKHTSWTLQQLVETVRLDVHHARTIPAESVFQSFRKMVRDLARDQTKEIAFHVQGMDVQADRMVLQMLKDPLMHLLRNAVVHGIEPSSERAAAGKDRVGQVHLMIESVGDRLVVVVQDDGYGLDPQMIAETAISRQILSEQDVRAGSAHDVLRVIFRPGFSTAASVTELSGRGMGLSVVHEAVSRLQGEVRLDSNERNHTRFIVSVPLSISTQRLLIVSSNDQPFAVPIGAVGQLLRIRFEAVESIEGKPYVIIENEPVPLIWLSRYLGLSDGAFEVSDDWLYIAAVRAEGRRISLAVDRILAERDSHILDLGGPASRVKAFSGGVLLEDGRIALVLNIAELVGRAQPAGALPTVVKNATQSSARDHGPTVLIVDDSFTTRTLEKSILEAHGYNVRVAVDGEEALLQLRSELVDLVVSDIQMPRMNGFELMEAMKADERLARVPVILVTSMDKLEDQERGMILGAEAYIVKRKFDHQELLNTIRQIV